MLINLLCNPASLLISQGQIITTVISAMLRPVRTQQSRRKVSKVELIAAAPFYSLAETVLLYVIV